MSLDNGLNISLQFTYFPFFLIKKREGGRGGVMEKKMILLLILKMIIYLFSNMCLYNLLLSSLNPVATCVYMIFYSLLSIQGEGRKGRERWG